MLSLYMNLKNIYNPGYVVWHVLGYTLGILNNSLSNAVRGDRLRLIGFLVFIFIFILCICEKTED